MTDKPPYGLLRKLKLYQTKAYCYLVGRTEDKQHFRLCKFGRLEGRELKASQDPSIYTAIQCQRVLDSIDAGNQAHGGLALILEADALIGCFRFVEGFYLLFVTQKTFIGTICGTHKVYSVGDIRLVALYSSEELAGKDELRYRKVLSGIELTKNFFFSFTWPIWHTVQAALTYPALDNPWGSMFVWNEYLTRPLRTLMDANLWVMPLIHGHWQQRTLSISAKALTVSIIARRSKYFAGTRYRKRGINDQGHVANDVETEQVVSAGMDWRSGRPIVSSVVQVRGSIPLFWTQENSQRQLKPDIALQRFDPLYEATRLHFQSMFGRYGPPIVVLSLLKTIEKQPRERLLGEEFEKAIKHIRKKLPGSEEIEYVPWDFKRCANQRGSQILTDISPCIKKSLRLTKIFVVAPSTSKAETEKRAGDGDITFQKGVLRTNCMDCLDRTNVAQFVLGLHALGLQLHALGISETPKVDIRSSMATELMSLYEQMGNTLAKQYGGSEAHSTVFKQQRGDWEYVTAVMDKLTSLRRFYNNTYTDSEKQDAVNLFLGNYIPIPGQPAIWQLDSDSYLHSGLGQRFLQRFFAGVESAQTVTEQGTAVRPPRISSGHFEGEGVRNYATLMAEAAAKLGARSADDSLHGSSRLQGLAVSNQRHADILTSKLEKLEAASRGLQALPATQSGYITDASGAESPEDKLSMEVKAIQRHEHVINLLSSGSTTGLLSITPVPGGEVKVASHGGLKARDQMIPASGMVGEPERLPQAKPGADGSISLQGLDRFKAEKGKARQPKLESFDRKLGRRPNAIAEVSLHAPGAGGSSFLPQWLAFPLGFSAGQKLSLSQPDLQASQALSRTAGALPNTLPQELPARPVLQRRSLDGPPAASSLATPPLARSRSETSHALDRQMVRDTIHEALSENIAKQRPSSVASPPTAYPPFASTGRGNPSLDSSCLSSLIRLPALPDRITSSKEVALGILAMSLTADGSPAEKDMQALLSDRPQQPGLGMSPALHSWWFGTSDAISAWVAEESRERSAYSEYIRKASELSSHRESEGLLTAQYARLTSCGTHELLPSLLPASDLTHNLAAHYPLLSKKPTQTLHSGRPSRQLF